MRACCHNSTLASQSGNRFDRGIVPADTIDRTRQPRRIEPPPHPPDPLALAELQHGVVARRQLRHPDRPPHILRHLLPASDWEPLTSEVVRRKGAPSTEAQRLMASVLDAGGVAALSHLPGGRWWGLSGCSSKPAHVVRTGSSRRGSELSVVHRVRSLPAHWVTLLDHVPVCRPELIALQLFAVCREDRAERLVDSLWSMRLLSGPSLERFIDEHGACGRNGTSGIRAYLAARGPGYVPPASGVESRAMELFARHGIPMRRQVNSGGEDGWTGRVDFRHELVPLIVEVQSERYHAALVDQLADAARIAALRADGYEVVEVTDTEVFARPGDALDRVRAAIRRLQNPPL